MKGLIGAVLIAWLVVGTVAAFQRGYFGNDRTVTCASANETGATMLAGPLNYLGVNPEVGCHRPHPSR